MKRGHQFEESVDALRDLMAVPTDGHPTRARVLVAVSRRADVRRRARRVVSFLAVLTIAMGSASVAFTALGTRWRRASEAAAPPAPDSRPAGATGLRPPRPAATRAPAALSDSRPDPGAGERDEENVLYGRAHELHFTRHSPGRALLAWDEYLRRYPGGSFAPEARFNRALCLVWLGKPRAAAQALRPFASGELGGYRRREACLLLDRLGEQVPACR
jgi:hypothetical protein